MILQFLLDWKAFFSRSREKPSLVSSRPSSCFDLEGSARLTHGSSLSPQQADETLNFEEQILEAAKSIAAATSALVKSASAAQRELVAQGKVGLIPANAVDDGQWSQGLISAVGVKLQQFKWIINVRWEQGQSFVALTLNLADEWQDGRDHCHWLNALKLDAVYHSKINTNFCSFPIIIIIIVQKDTSKSQFNFNPFIWFIVTKSTSPWQQRSIRTLGLPPPSSYILHLLSPDCLISCECSILLVPLRLLIFFTPTVKSWQTQQ